MSWMRRILVVAVASMLVVVATAGWHHLMDVGMGMALGALVHSLWKTSPQEEGPPPPEATSGATSDNARERGHPSR